MAYTAFRPASGFLLSKAQLKRQRGLLGSPLYDFMERYAARDVVRTFDDFTGDTIDLNYYALANSGGTAVANFAIQVLANGVIRAASGTTDDGSVSLIGPLIYAGDNNCGMEARFKLSAVTGLNFEVGFIDAVPAANAGGVTDIDVPTLAATDAALLTMDTDQTLTTLAFATKGGTAGMDALKKTLGAIPGLTGASSAIPVAAEYLTVRIQLEGNMASCWVNGKNVEHTAQAAGHVEGGTLLAPWIYVRTRNTTTKVFDLDYLEVWADRA